MSIFTIPGNTPWAKPPDDNGASDLVKDGFVTAQGFAESSVQSAHDFLGELAQAVIDLQVPLLAADLVPLAPPAGFVAPPVPTAPAGLALELPAAPVEPALAAVSALVAPAAPQFTDVPLPLVLPAAPSPLASRAPDAPALPDVAVPAAPGIVLPDVPTLLGIDIPGAPVLNLPSFSATLAASPDAPANSFAFAEPGYTSPLLDKLRVRLTEWLDGAATGLSAQVEQAVWERGRAREGAVLARKMAQALRGFAQRGFARPPGALALAQADALQDSQGTLSALSRDVMVKQAELEQSNRHFAIETAFKVESELIGYQNLVAQRGFEAAKYAQQVALDIFHELVVRYGADVAAYQAQASVFKTLVEAELAKLDVYKATLEGQKLIGELNTQAISIYTARISGALAQVELFKNQVAAANLMLEGNKVRIESFAATVAAYDSTVRAKATEYQGYATAVQAEATKVDMFRSQAEAFRSQADAYHSSVEAAVALKNSEIEVGLKLPLEVFKTRTEVFRTRVETEATRTGALLKRYETDAQLYGAAVGGESARVGADTTLFRSESDSAVAAATLRLEAGKQNLQMILHKTTLLFEAIKAGAQVSAQMAASALGAVNLSAQISAGTTQSAQNQASNSTSNQIASQIGDMTHHNISSKAE